MSNKYIDYLYGRGLSDNTINAFGISVCDPVGHCIPELKPFIDYRFYDSVLFPIRDVYNEIVAVGSRTVDIKKYVHTSYTKSRHLFGLNVTYPEIIRTRKV